jgi:hypothetical protein
VNNLNEKLRKLVPWYEVKRKSKCCPQGGIRATEVALILIRYEFLTHFVSKNYSRRGIETNVLSIS